MAVWQYVAYLVPTASLQEDGTLTGIVTHNDGFELPTVAFPFEPPEFEALANDYLPPAKSWSPKIRIWGDDAKDDVDLFVEDGRVVEVRVRLDLRDVTIERVQRLVRFAQMLRCCFVEGRKGEVVPAREDALLQSIRESLSAQFVTDPRGFFDRLSQPAAEQPTE
jgi:hypothetical protein